MKSFPSVVQAGALGALVLAFALASCKSDPAPAGPSVVNETGYLIAESIHYTAEEPLGESAQAVTVLGTPGAVSRLGGELSINGEDAITVSDPEGVFVLSTDGSLDDELELRYLLDGELSQLTLSLDQRLQAFQVQGGDPDSGIATDREPWLQPGEQPGHVSVTDLVDPPYLVYNAERGFVVRVDDPDTIEIEAEQGEAICVAQLDPDSGAATTSDCLAAP